ncbi:MAG: protoglobin domain-containing protein [Methylococcaceae bacterium]|nr:protoglobin domain-containing protein [Methylococcaceae bacterium]
MSYDFDALIGNSKSLSGLTPELEVCLKEIAPILVPQLEKVTDTFYLRLIMIPNTSLFLESRMEQLDKLKATHLAWLTSLFTRDINAEFAKDMRHVGDVHVSIQLPIEFMAGSMSLINKELIKLIIDALGDDKEQCTKALQAITAVTGLTLIIMQKSYQLWD